MSKRITKTALTNRKRIDVLYKNISSYIHIARCNVLRTVDTEQVKAYWLIDRDIVEEEQKGKYSEEYGSFLLREMSLRLIKGFGQGFVCSTLADIRKFYLTYPKVHALRGEFMSENVC